MKKKTRIIKIGDTQIGGGNPVLIQSMAATPTRDLEATLGQVEMLHRAGAGLVRVACDNARDVESLKEIRSRTKARLSVDLQENYLLAELIAPHVDKIRYNPGHLHRLNPKTPIQEKVSWLAGVARKNHCAIRVGVNCGSVAPDFLEKYSDHRERAIVESALWHCELLDGCGFKDYVVSLKDSDPLKVVRVNEEFSKKRPDVPLHLGVTEAGMPPEGITKTRMALEKLLAKGIGDTLRVSLTVPFDKKHEEIAAGEAILKDVSEGRFLSVPEGAFDGLNIISCPSCSRVENTAFIDLAVKIRELAAFAKDAKLTIAVMGCRVNGPGETDDADLGLWCGPKAVTLKRKTRVVGSFSYEKILPAVEKELRELAASAPKTKHASSG